MKTSALLLLLTILAVLSREAPLASAAETPAATSSFVETRDRLLNQAQAKGLTAKEHFDLSVALLGTGQYGEALVVSRMGMGLTQEPKAKSLFLMVAAQCHGAQGYYFWAADAALEGQRLNPLSMELAALRFAYFTKVGNAAQAKSAEDTLKQLYPNGQPVLTGVELIAIAKGVIEIVAAIKVIYEVTQEAWPKVQPEVERVAVRMTELWAKLSASGGRTTVNLRAR